MTHQRSNLQAPLKRQKLNQNKISFFSLSFFSFSSFLTIYLLFKCRFVA